MPPIRQIGKPMLPDSEGFLGNEARISKIPALWSEAVEHVQKAYIEHHGPQIRSLYLRGSLPRGEAFEGISDIDTFSIVDRVPDVSELAWIPDFKRSMKKKFPFIGDIEIHFFPYESLVHALGYLSLRFTIKHLSACLWGEDLSEQFPRFKPSLKIAFAFHGFLGREIRETLSWLSEPRPPRGVQKACSWIMKRIVRTGASILMEQENAYVRDLYPCYEIFSRHYPEREPEMRQALEWAVEPSADTPTIARFLGSFGSWLTMESRRIFDANQV